MTQPFTDPFAQENAGEEEFELPLDEVVNNTIPKGRYEAYSNDLTRNTSEAGNPMYIFDFMLTGRSMANNLQSVDEGLMGKGPFKVFCALTPKALWKLGEVTEAMGIGESGKASAIKKADALGILVLVDIEDSTYNGRTNSNITTVLAHPAGKGKKYTRVPAGVPE